MALHRFLNALARGRLFAVAPALALAFAAALTPAQADPIATTTVLRASPSSSLYGRTVTLTATVTPGAAGIPIGSVQFFRNSDALGVPVSVSPITGATGVGINEYHACAIVPGGGVKCWGNNVKGELGDGTNAQRATPVAVSTLSSGVAAIATGLQFTCALTSSGGVKCWGDNSNSQLGEGSTNGSENLPTEVTGATSGIVAIASGGFHSCAINTSGGVVCWGSNAYGQLGNTTPNVTSAALVNVSGISSGAVAITAGKQHTCALIDDGTVKCWGNSQSGQLGDGTVNGASHPTPVTVSGIGTATAIAGNYNHTCVVLADHTAQCWGANDRKQLGDGNGGSAGNKSAMPVTVLGVSNATTIAAGFAHSCVVRTNGVASCWGDNQSGEIGNNNSSSTPADIDNVLGVTAVSLVAGGYSTCTITNAAGLKCWGNNNVNQLGDNTVFPRSLPVDVNGLGDGAMAVAVQAKFPTSTLKADTHILHAVFTSGDSFFASSSSPDTELFVQGLPSTTTISANTPNPSTLGSTVTFTVTVTGSDVTVDGGQVTLRADDDSDTDMFAAVSSGSATFTTSSLALGTHDLQASFSGNDIYGTSQSATVQQVVKGGTTLAVEASPASAKVGQSVTLLARLSVTAPAVTDPTGSVTFKEGSKTIGSGPVNSGQASVSTSALTIGSHTITATYPGSALLFGSSGTTTVAVSAAVGAEGVVNTHTAGAQQNPAAARLKAGYLIVWASDGQDGSGFGVYAQRYTAAGVKAGAELSVNTVTVNNQTQPAAAGLANGTFVAVWQSAAQDGSGLGVYGQRFTAAGTKLGSEFRVNTAIAKDQSLPSIAALSDGGFLVAWTSDGQDGSGLGIYAQRYSATGVKVGAEFKVNKTTSGAQTNSAVSGLTGGGFVVAWQGPDASGIGVYAQRYDSTAKAVGNELRVNSATVNDQSMPVVAPLDNGGFVIAWQSALQDGSGLGVYMQRYTSLGAKSGGEARVNSATANDQAAPAIAGFTDGGYLVVWQSKLQDGSGQGVYAQAFTDGGAKANVEFRVNTRVAGDQFQPTVAAFALGNLVVAWTSVGQDGNLGGIYAQRALVPGTH